MSKQDTLKEKISRIEGKLRFFRNAILAIVSGLVWSVYAILENKISSKTFILIGIGIVFNFKFSRI